jgi:hypothetical protein
MTQKSIKNLTLQDVDVVQLKSFQTSFDGVKDVLIDCSIPACIYCKVEIHLATQTVLVDESIFIRGQARTSHGERRRGKYREVDLQE